MKLVVNPEYGLYEKRGQAYCDSLQIAKELNKRHDHILRDIESKLADISQSNAPEFGEINFLPDFYKDERNRKQPRYLLTKDGFVFLVTSYGGKKVTNFKIAYITRFNQMESFIKSLQTAKLEFPAFTYKRAFSCSLLFYYFVHIRSSSNLIQLIYDYYQELYIY